jgi:tetratricopeptide (TPR) repeat protein
MALAQRFEFPDATDGRIAILNLESARQQAWSRFWQAPERPGIAEHIFEQEKLVAQFLGDFRAFERLQGLVTQLTRNEPDAARTSLIAAQLASTVHQFVDAREWLKRAAIQGADREAINRLDLSIDQATASGLDLVLEARCSAVARSQSLDDLVPLGALLADLQRFEEANDVYLRALGSYRDVSPFALAGVCFQLGALWGELIPEPELEKAASWYERAISYLPCYVRARVHLAEIYASTDRAEEAERLLRPVIEIGDPEVSWRLADILTAAGRLLEAETHLRAAHAGFEALLDKFPLAFADHGADFYFCSGNDRSRAFRIARINLQNRPTIRAFKQAHTIAVGVGDLGSAAEILAMATRRCGSAIGAMIQTKGAPK